MAIFNCYVSSPEDIPPSSLQFFKSWASTLPVPNNMPSCSRKPELSSVRDSTFESMLFLRIHLQAKLLVERGLVPELWDFNSSDENHQNEKPEFPLNDASPVVEPCWRNKAGMSGDGAFGHQHFIPWAVQRTPFLSTQPHHLASHHAKVSKSLKIIMVSATATELLKSRHGFVLL